MAKLKSTPWIASLCLGVSFYAHAANAADNMPSVTCWEFGTEDVTPLKASGKVQRDHAGPRPPEFPDMAANNTAVRVDARAYLSTPDEGTNSDFDFNNGDSITIEAWVNPSVLRNGQVSYVVGKGRTGSPTFARDNQNWSMRIVGSQNEAKLSFLFATKLTDSEAHWHRWDFATWISCWDRVASHCHCVSVWRPPIDPWLGQWRIDARKVELRRRDNRATDR